MWPFGGKSRRKSTRRKLRLESLERREVLAGDVTAAVVRGSLVITGDSQLNDVVVDQTALPAGSFRVSSGATSATTINGAAGPVVLAGVTRDVQVSLKAGNDIAALNTLSVPRDLTVTGGDGNNNVAMTSVSVARTLYVKNDLGNDNVNLATITTGKQLIVFNGDGGSTTTILGANVGTKLLLKAREGSDVIRLNDMTVGGSTTIETGAGGDTVEIETQGVLAGPSSNFAGKVKVSLSTGNDLLRVGVDGQAGRNATFQRKVTASGGSDTDTLDVNNGNTFASTVRTINFETIVT